MHILQNLEGEPASRYYLYIPNHGNIKPEHFHTSPWKNLCLLTFPIPSQYSHPLGRGCDHPLMFFDLMFSGVTEDICWIIQNAKSLEGWTSYHSMYMLSILLKVIFTLALSRLSFHIQYSYTLRTQSPCYSQSEFKYWKYVKVVCVHYFCITVLRIEHLTHA